MFSTQKEEKAIKIYEEQFMVPARSMIANSILSAIRISSQIIADPSNLALPKSAYFDTACHLGHTIDKFLVRLIDDDNFSGILYSEPEHGHGRPCVEYRINGIVFQLKKEKKVEKLPANASYRIEKSRNNQSILEFGEEYYSTPMYMLVTYNHKRFVTDYMQIGFPREDYSGWLHRWNLMPYIQEEQVEYILKKYGSKIREEYQEKINKKYQISLK